MILRYIWAQGLEIGSQLPATQQLGTELGICMNTMQSAMKTLTDSGFVQRQRKKGTIVCRREPAGEGAKFFTVGVLWRRDESSAYGFSLYKSIRDALQLHGCEDRTYPYDFPFPDRPKYRVGEVPSLTHDLEHDQVDALVTPVNFRQDDVSVPICQLAMHDDGSWGTQLDRPGLVRQAVLLLKEMGHVRPAVVYSATQAPENYHLDIQTAHDTLAQAGLTPSPANLMVAGREVTNQEIFKAWFLDRLPDQRPDALVVTDDHRAHDLAQRIRDLGEHPLMVIQANKQIPFRYALPVVRFEFDVAEHAEISVRLLMRRLLGMPLKQRVTLIPCRLVWQSIPERWAGGLSDSWRLAGDRAEDLCLAGPV